MAWSHKRGAHRRTSQKGKKHPHRGVKGPHKHPAKHVQKKP